MHYFLRTFATVAIALAGGASLAQDQTDAELLSAAPISRARMELIWLEPVRLQRLAGQVRAAGGRLAVTFHDTGDDDWRDVEISQSDIDWARDVEKVVDLAYAAGQQGRCEESVRHYKRALRMAPGGDLFLMSIGVCYVQMGQKARGIRFLERATQITPTNGRIRRNLEAARSH